MYIITYRVTSEADVEELISEKDQQIKELLEEGELYGDD